jgi:hypothetical protein
MEIKKVDMIFPRVVPVSQAIISDSYEEIYGNYNMEPAIPQCPES